jgi:single-strand DNA-binding protein
MTSLNRVFLIGNLTREPDLRYTPKGTPVVEINLAINRALKTEDGTKHEETTFVAVTLWDRLGETALKYLKKGNPVFIEGRLKLDTREDKQSGQQQTRLRVIGQNLQLLGKRSEAGSASLPPVPVAAHTSKETKIAPASTTSSTPSPARMPIPEPDWDLEPL